MVSRKCSWKEQKPVVAFFFFCKTIGSNIFFYSNWKQFQVLKISKFEFKVTIHYRLWAKCTQLWPLKGELHPKTKSSMFGEKSQNYQHIYRPKLIVRKLINDIKILVGQAVLELWTKTIFCIVLINYPTPFFWLIKFNGEEPLDSQWNVWIIQFYSS